MTMSVAEYWGNRYRENGRSRSGRSWSGRVNASLEREVAGIRPGTALDLGSGEGGDALWLAHNGWTVTAVDISPTALAIGAGCPAARLRDHLDRGRPRRVATADDLRPRHLVLLALGGRDSAWVDSAPRGYSGRTRRNTARRRPLRCAALAASGRRRPHASTARTSDARRCVRHPVRRLSARPTGLAGADERPRRTGRCGPGWHGAHDRRQRAHPDAERVAE